MWRAKLSGLSTPGAGSKRSYRRHSTLQRNSIGFLDGLCIIYNHSMHLAMCFSQRRVHRIFRLGIYLFTAMEWTSAVGYTFFPISGSSYAGTFQDIMHIVVTIFVVLLSIVSMILIAVGCFRSKIHKKFGVFTLAILGIMALGSISSGIIPVGYFGVAERASVYSVVFYSGALSLFTFNYRT